MNEHPALPGRLPEMEQRESSGHHIGDWNWDNGRVPFIQKRSGGQRQSPVKFRMRHWGDCGRLTSSYPVKRDDKSQVTSDSHCCASRLGRASERAKKTVHLGSEKCRPRTDVGQGGTGLAEICMDSTMYYVLVARCATSDRRSQW